MFAWITDILRTRTPEEMLQQQLASAQRERIAYLASQEEHAAYVSMLDKRIVRIRTELAKINPTTQENP